ncbi:MAG: hypothetical protein KME08_08300 [Aphanothece sp. CMT-3BRIN-NPC111]|jgi:hypothetical protein|nr:hypothetical protein [Aphanothece sp. CMT-3BRIN-NPC111]
MENTTDIPKRVLILAGMHRSGTSLVSHYLEKCGLNMGEKLVPADVGNVLGYFEDQDFLNFHKAALIKNGIGTFLPEKSSLPIRVEGIERERAMEILRARKHLNQWGWKEPRTTLFLDFWFEIVENARFLFLIRHPLGVADSLLRRGTDANILRKPILGLKAWRIYNEEVLRFTRLHPDVSLVYEIDDLIRQPEKFRLIIEKKFQIKLNAAQFEEVFSKNNFNLHYSPKVWRLQVLRIIEFLQCMRLYEKLQALHEYSLQ